LVVVDEELVTAWLVCAAAKGVAANITAAATPVSKIECFMEPVPVYPTGTKLLSRRIVPTTELFMAYFPPA
jgi:hypothetical protein